MLFSLVWVSYDIRSEGLNDPTAVGEGQSLILLNGVNHCPQKRGINLVAISALAGKLYYDL